VANLQNILLPDYKILNKMIDTISYIDAHRKWGVVVVRRGGKKENIEIAFIPHILDEAKLYEQKHRVWIRRIKAQGLPDRNKKPFPKSSIVRKSLGDNIRLEFNDRSGNLSLFLDGVRVDMVKVE